MSKKHICPWLSAAENRGNLSQYQSILRQGDPDSLDSLPQDFLEEWKSSQSGAGAFHYAANHGLRPETTIGFLVSRGLDPNGLSLKGAPVLGHALNRGKDDSLAWCRGLLAAGARIDMMPCKGASILLAGVQSNRVEFVEMAVAGGASRTYPDDPQFQSKMAPEAHKVLHTQPDKVRDGVLAMDRLLPPTQDDIDRQWLFSIRHGQFLWADHFAEAGANLVVVDFLGNNGLHLLAELASSHYRRLDERMLEWVEKLCATGLSSQETNAANHTPLDVVNGNIHGLDEMASARFTQSIHNGQAKHLDNLTVSVPATRSRPRL